MDGIIIINKPKNYTSHDIVRKAKKIFNEKVGHTGTLDPNATGVLPLLVGKGTQLSKYLINHDKKYEAVLKLGIKTDTADIEGQVIEKQEVQLSKINKENVQAILKSFIGKQKQVPPMYSAIKVNGKKLYEYARKGENIKIEPRIIEIYDMKLIDIKNEEITFEVYCSKGTYIRTLCEQIAEKLETVGYMKELKRLQVGEFKLQDAINIEEVQDNLEKKFITVEEYFIKEDKITLDDRKLILFLNGVKLTYNTKDGIYRIYNGNKFIGIGIVENKLLKREIIIIKNFNL